MRVFVAGKETPGDEALLEAIGLEADGSQDALRDGYATIPVAIAHASTNGELIKRAQARMAMHEPNENILWVEGMMMHLNTPLPAGLRIPEDSPLLSDSDDPGSDAAKITQLMRNGVPLRVEVRREHAEAALGTMTLQPIDMRDDATGHEREAQGTTNGIRGVVAETEIRDGIDGPEIWVAFAFWMREFKEEAQFLLRNLPYMGMSVQMGTRGIALSPYHPSTVMFTIPRFYGGCVLFRDLAADKKTLIGAVAERRNSSNPDANKDKENAMDPKEILELAEKIADKIGNKYEATAEAKDAMVETLKSSLAEVTASNLNALKGELETVITERLESEKAEAIAAAEGKVTEAEAKAADAESKVTELTEKVAALEASLAEATTAKETAETKLAAIEETARAEALLSERTSKLAEIHPFAEGELSDDLKAEITAADDKDFQIMVMARQIEKLSNPDTTASKTEGKTEEKDADIEARGSAHGQFKNTGGDNNKKSPKEMGAEFALCLD